MVKKASNKKFLIIALLLTLMLLALTLTSYVFADIGFFIEENYIASSATNYFTIGENYYYSEELTQGQTQLSLSVTRHIINEKILTDKFDLLIYLPKNTEISSSHTSQLIENADEDIYLFRNIEFESESSQMGLSFTLSNASDGDIKAAIITSDEKNVYIDDMFDLRMLSNENLHNIFYTTPFSDWQTVGSGQYEINTVTLTVFDVGQVKYKDGTTLANLIGSISLDLSTIAFSFDKLTLASGLTIAGGNTIEFYLTNGYYYNDACGLRLALEDDEVIIQTLLYSSYESYKNVYFVSDVTIDEQFILNIPCSINLLYANLNLNEDLTIAHPYGGSFSFVAIPGGGKVNNTSKSLYIKTPNAYYTTSAIEGGIEGALLNNDNFSKYSENIDFSKEENASLREELSLDALSFAKACLPEYAYSDILLQKSYHYYGISYRYNIVSEALNTFGIVTRGENTIEAEVVIEVYLDNSKIAEDTKSIKIIGTSEASMFNATSEILNNYIISSCSENSGTYYLNKKVEIYYLLDKYIKALGIQNQFALNVEEGLSFVVNYQVGETIESLSADQIEFIINSDNIVLSQGGEGISSLAKDNIVSIYLKKDDIVLQEKEVELSIIYNYDNGTYLNSVVKEVSIRGMTFFEKTAYLERFMETLYITENNSALEVLQLVVSDGFYKGTLANGYRVIEHDLGSLLLNYSVYMVSADVFDSFNAKEINLDTMLSDQDTLDKTTSFNISDGIITANKIKIESDYRLVLCTEIAFDTEVIQEQNYIAVRQIIIPAGGLGESDYIEYTRGDTFASYFNTLEKGMLIDSTITVGEEIGSAYPFAPFEDGVFLEMSIENPLDVIAGGEVFCELIKNASDYYQISINPDNIPSKNTVVSLYVRFYIGVDTTISEQYYSFVIPGIYKYGRDVGSMALYNRMLEVYENYDNKYLLVDGANAQTESFDCSVSTLDLEVNENVSLMGIEKLINTKAMNFDGVRIASLEPFAYLTSQNLESLSLKNCGINDALIMAETDGKPNLYHLNKLKKIYLDGNAITKVVNISSEAYLYRSVEEIYLSAQRSVGQRCLTNIAGIGAMSNLKVIDISDNAIAEFLPLTDCAKLTNVYLADNLAAEFGNKDIGDSLVYYGTSGLINKAVYVKLISAGVAIEDIINPYAEDERILILALNAISIMKTQYGTITVPSQARILSTEEEISYNISVEYVIKQNSAVAFSAIEQDTERNNISSIAFTDGDEVKIVMSITDGGVTVYSLFTFIYRENN